MRPESFKVLWAVNVVVHGCPLMYTHMFMYISGQSRTKALFVLAVSRLHVCAYIHPHTTWIQRVHSKRCWEIDLNTKGCMMSIHHKSANHSLNQRLQIEWPSRLMKVQPCNRCNIQASEHCCSAFEIQNLWCWITAWAASSLLAEAFLLKLQSTSTDGEIYITTWTAALQAHDCEVVGLILRERDYHNCFFHSWTLLSHFQKPAERATKAQNS